MRQGLLATTSLPEIDVQAARHPRHFGPTDIRDDPDWAPRPRRPIRLGENLLRAVPTLLLGGVVVITGILLLDFGVAKYQQIQLRERSERIARLADMALSSLQSDIQSVTDLGDGHYRLALYLLNAGGGDPTFVMLQYMRAYVQVGNVWQEVPLRSADDGTDGVLRIDGRHVYQFLFDAQVRSFTQLLPNYMHVRFSDAMLVSPSRTPKDDLFERRDNYYVYLKPSDITDDIILKKMKFSGKPPVWIPMPPH
jgi:putative ABC transport system ATP-binding protein/macrolide transport system ATP-binding/permease protein/lipoprotein-releasing system ATP-binding protein